MSKRAYIEAIERELESWPGVTVRFEQGRKHCRAIFTYRGAERFQTFPSTPSDGVRGVLNNTCEVRLRLRELGATRIEQPKRADRRERNHAAPRRAELPTISDPRPDGFAALRELHARMQQEQAPPRPSLWTRLQMFARKIGLERAA